jgi:hypothetical protein
VEFIIAYSGEDMSIYAYSLVTYCLTAILSLGVIGVIVGLTKLMGMDNETTEG